MNYMVWFFFIDGIGVLILSALTRKERWRADMRAQLKWGAVAGLSSLVTFGLALYAFSLAPIAQMSAIRETSIVFAALFARLFLKERFGRQRITLAFILAGGLILMQIA
jgi:drug/metabolite transporter (DMT)-like permease